MNKGSIFFIVVILIVLALIFIPKKKNVNAPTVDETTISEEETASVDLQTSSIEVMSETTIDAETSTEVMKEGVTEVETTTVFE